jgi:molybdopterin-guanine dinucleotide biosynthesis protein A
MYDIPIVIFAGGKSSRMGQDKALMPFGEYNTLAQFQYNRLSKIFKNIFISSKSNKFDFGANIIYDNQEDISSPLVGLISTLQTIKQDTFILSVDAPFVDATVFEQIIQNHNKSFDATIAKSPQGLEPLCGIYSPSIIKNAKQNLQQNNHSLTKLLKTSNTNYIDFDDKKLFTNLNYMQDYTNAIKLC